MISKVPALRFKDDRGNDFSEWEEKMLGEVGLFSKGKGISKADVSEDGVTPCVRYGELYTEYSELIEETKSRTDVSTDELVLSSGNEVIIPASGETHIDIATASCVISDGIALGGDLNIIRTKLNGVFLAYYLNNACKIAIARVAQGSSVVHLYPDQLKSLSLAYPSIDEQTKIADFLTAVDGRIGQLIQKKALLTDYKKGVMQQLFTQAIRFKDDHGNDFPDWEEKKLGEVCDVNPKSTELPESFIYIDLESVNDGRLHSPRKIAKTGAPSRAQRLLKKGDILYQTVRPYQMNNYRFGLDEVHVASTGYAQLRVTEHDAEFVYQSVHLPDFVGKVLDRCTGTSYPAINSKDLAKIKLGVPALEEQNQIANFLSAIDQKIENVTTQITETQTFKRGLLQQMFV